MTVTMFINAAEIVTCTGGRDHRVLTGQAVAVRDGTVEAVGGAAELAARFHDAERVDCRGGVLTPGLVDSHTHAIFGRWRADEYALRCRGVPYMEIARRGGGINASVRDLRARTEDELVELARPRLREMLRLGTTTVEIKSGYGLTTDDELKTLRAIRRLAETQARDQVRRAPDPGRRPTRRMFNGQAPDRAAAPDRTPDGTPDLVPDSIPSLVPTFLGAHEFPPEYRDRRDAYVELVVEEMIPAVAEAGLARFCDVFMEPGVFDGDQARRVLEAGLEHGLRPKLHADELEPSGGAELAVELGAASADHLGRVSEAGIRALGRSDTVATLLPATLFFLGGTEYAPARALLEAGATIALATDFNPGSSPTPSLPLTMTIACSQMGLDPLEALTAATAGGARALGLEDGRGTIHAGAPADLVLWAVEDHREIPYRFGVDLVAGAWKRGARVV